MASAADASAGRSRPEAARASDLRRSRRAGRRLALAAIFEADFGQRTPAAILERHLGDTERDPVAADLARAIVAAVGDHRVEIDARIERLATRYPVVQLARMDRSLLRCAVGEVLHSPTPARVAIAEWVELARIYSGDPMRRLMNGVLGRLAQEPVDERPGAPSSEEGVSGQHLRAPQEDRRRAARRRGG
jgi:N utilization substance protein B